MAPIVHRWLTFGVALAAFAALIATASAAFVEAPGSPVAVGSFPADIAVADFDGDGNPDLATANLASNDVSVVLGDGGGGFSAAPGSPIAVGQTPLWLATADVDGDGDPD